MEENEKGISEPPPNPTELRLRAAIEVFLEYLAEEGRTAVTIVRYRAYFASLIESAGDVLVETIDGEVISRFKKRLMNAGLSPATINGHLSVLRSLLRYLGEVKQLEVWEPEKVRGPKIPMREVSYLSKEEMGRFVDAIPTKKLMGLRDRALVEVLASTGMRISEALALNRDDIDWQTREAAIVGKGNKPRRIFFSDESLEWIKRYLAKRYDTNSALFASHWGEVHRLKAQGSWRRFHRYGRLAGLSKAVYPHMLRHTMATTLLKNGCPIGHIRTLLGHAHLATTCRYHLGVVSYAEAKVAHRKYLSYV